MQGAQSSVCECVCVCMYVWGADFLSLRTPTATRSSPQAGKNRKTAGKKIASEKQTKKEHFSSLRKRNKKVHVIKNKPTPDLEGLKTNKQTYRQRNKGETATPLSVQRHCYSRYHAPNYLHFSPQARQSPAPHPKHQGIADEWEIFFLI